MFSGQREVSKWTMSLENISIGNRCGYSINPARKLDSLTQNNFGILVDFSRRCLQLYLQDWLYSESLKMDSPRTDKWSGTDMIEHVYVIAVQAPGRRIQQLT
jgi:hypothetical protein